MKCISAYPSISLRDKCGYHLWRNSRKRRILSQCLLKIHLKDVTGWQRQFLWQFQVDTHRSSLQYYHKTCTHPSTDTSGRHTAMVCHVAKMSGTPRPFTCKRIFVDNNYKLFLQIQLRRGYGRFLPLCIFLFPPPLSYPSSNASNQSWSFLASWMPESNLPSEFTFVSSYQSKNNHADCVLTDHLSFTEIWSLCPLSWRLDLKLLWVMCSVIK